MLVTVVSTAVVVQPVEHIAVEAVDSNPSASLPPNVPAVPDVTTVNVPSVPGGPIAPVAPVDHKTTLASPHKQLDELVFCLQSGRGLNYCRVG
jgi:hypothetical protein